MKRAAFKEWVGALLRRLVTVVVPIFNEAEGLAGLAKRLTELAVVLQPRHDLEIVLVDDGSVDRSLALARQLFATNPQVIYASHYKNLGLGAAIRTGWREANGEIICTIDADCTYEPAKVVQLLEALEAGADIATGSPYHPEGSVANASGWRLFLSRCASQLYRLVSGEKLYTFTSLMRAYKRPVIENVQFTENGFVSVAEILLRSIWAGYRVVEVPMELHSRVSGTSKMKIARTIAAHLELMARSSIWRKQFVMSSIGRPRYPEGSA
jgi:dolichol-phosphate mannosyltransferase